MKRDALYGFSVLVQGEKRVKGIEMWFCFLVPYIVIIGRGLRRGEIFRVIINEILGATQDLDKHPHDKKKPEHAPDHCLSGSNKEQPDRQR